MIFEQTKWVDSNGKEYRVLSRTVLDGNVWIHYIRDAKNQDDIKEYSCYEESFLSRFRQIPND